MTWYSGSSGKRPILTTAFSIIYLGTDIPIFSLSVLCSQPLIPKPFFFGDISLTTLASLTCIYNLVQEENRTNLQYNKSTRNSIFALLLTFVIATGKSFLTYLNYELWHNIKRNIDRSQHHKTKRAIKCFMNIQR